MVRLDTANSGNSLPWFGETFIATVDQPRRWRAGAASGSGGTNEIGGRIN